MLNISRSEIKAKLVRDNPWWTEPEALDGWMYADLPYRDYFEGFYNLSQESGVRRAVVLMGPRRVGKTVMLHQAIHKSLRRGVDGKRLMYISIDQPLYTGMALEQIVSLFLEVTELAHTEEFSLFFDEIQYLKDWEVHLKALVDAYPNARFVASGSAAAALRLKSRESGAGRFTDFMLPPLTFAEFLRFTWNDYFPDLEMNTHFPEADALNEAFLGYLNFGGYPEAVINEEIRSDVSRFIQKDIIDKALLKDLPSLYGINDVQELNKLFMVIAYNSGNEFSYPNLSSASGIAKETIKRYIEYLEAAFLIKKVVRIDDNGKTFKRERSFKLYLTNPSIRAALFQPVGPDDDAIGDVVETGIYSQYFHSNFFEYVRYARWRDGEVDVVIIDPTTRLPMHVTEVKWSDRQYKRTEELSHLIMFAKKHRIASVDATTRTIFDQKTIDGVVVNFRPSSGRCLALGQVSVEYRLEDLLTNESITGF